MKLINQRIEELLETKSYHEHLFPLPTGISKPVENDFPYIKKGKQWLICKLEEKIIVNPYTTYINISYRSKIYGRNNYKGLDKAIVVCNHVVMMDCLVARKALNRRIPFFTKNRLFITAATFNNRKGFFGEMMRAGGLLPFGKTKESFVNIDKSIKTLLEKNNYVMFYPEEAMWNYYEEIRPHRPGAYHYATKNNVAILPVFITFTNRRKKDKDGDYLKKTHMHILSPIYPKEGLTKTEQKKYLEEEVKKSYIKKYEEFYKRKYKEIE